VEETVRRFAAPLADGYVVEGSLDGCLAFFEFGPASAVLRRRGLASGR